MKKENIIDNTATATEKNKVLMSFNKAVCVYLIGGLTGTLWETILNLFKGKGFVFCNGSLFTPFNFVYGLGALFIIFCLKNQTKIWKVYLIGFIGGGGVEYILNFLEEKVLGTRSWNYSDRLLNINGRTTLIYMAFWGILCVILFLAYKPLDKLLDKLPYKPVRIFAIVMAVILAIDFMLTVSVLIRYSARNSDNEANLFIEEFIDNNCNDDFMKRRFPNMKFV